jgi:hypothetical protein
VALRVGLSTRDASIPNRTYDSAFEGLITLLEPAGRDQYLVRDEQPVMIAANDGILAAMCPVDDIPHIVTLGFTKQGLTPVQAWRIDLESTRLVEVPVDSLPCPDLSLRSVGDDGVGGIVTHLGCDPDIGCDHRYLSLSASGANPTGFWSLGGGVLPGDAYYSGHAVGQTADVYPVDRSESFPARLWLEEEIGRDWTGKTIWRVIDATPTTSRPIADMCYLSNGDGSAFAEIESWANPIPLRAWTVDADYSHFEEISTDAVRCETEEGD